MMILILAANTSFADFPRLSSILARDRFLPRQLTNLGDRLVFSNGILTLAGLASLLVVIFKGETHRLIPLYAVGVFLSFTLSQSGMVRHWCKLQERGWHWKATINGLGAAATGVVLGVIVATKFLHGAWIVLLLMMILVWVFLSINRHYHSIAKQLSLDGMQPKPWTNAASTKRHKVIVPVSGMHRGTLKALQFARALSKDVRAVIVDVDPAVTARVEEKWKTWGHDIPLVVLESPYRSTLQPLMAHLEQVDNEHPERGPAVVVLPEFVPAGWWQHFLHNQNALILKTALLFSPARGQVGRVIIDVPYHLQR